MRHVPGIGTVADGEYTFEPEKAEEYVNLDYTPTAPDGTVYADAAWGAEEEAPAEDSAMEPADSAQESVMESASVTAPVKAEESASAAEEEAPAAEEKSPAPAETAETSNTPVVIAVIVVLVIVIAAVIVVKKKKKS